MLERGTYRITLAIERAEDADGPYPVAPIDYRQYDIEIRDWLEQRSRFLVAHHIDAMRDEMLAEVFNEDWRADRGGDRNAAVQTACRDPEH